jgi:hypothetical protein
MSGWAVVVAGYVVGAVTWAGLVIVAWRSRTR